MTFCVKNVISLSFLSFLWYGLVSTGAYEKKDTGMSVYIVLANGKKSYMACQSYNWFMKYISSETNHDDTLAAEFRSGL